MKLDATFSCPLLNLNQDHPSKNCFSGQIVLSQDNLFHKNATITELSSHNHMYNII